MPTHTCLTSYCYRSHHNYSQRNTEPIPHSVRSVIDADRKRKELLLAQVRSEYEDAPRRIAFLEKSIEELNAFLGRS